MLTQARFTPGRAGFGVRAYWLLLLACLLVPVAAQEVRVSFGDNDVGGGWNNVAAEQLNSGVAVVLKDVTGDLSGIQLHGFGHLDASWNAYDPKDFGLGNSGIWNGGVSKGPFTSDAAQEYVLV